LVHDEAEKLGAKMKKALAGGNAEVLGPAPAPLTRLKGRYRMHLLVKTADLAAVVPPLKRVVQAAAKGRLIQATLDVDPLGML
jgi:primosomal protein N' (replication factor Y)